MECPTCGARNLPHAAACASCDADLPRDDGEEEVDPLIGKTVAGKYEVTAIIGVGSMGTVYAATQAELDREIALKVLHPHVAADPKVERRFHREARTASRLSHPNTVQVFDYGKEDDGATLYIAMELLDGPDLLEIVDEESPLTPRRIGHLVGEVLLALEEAHDHGVIHRDLKPENIVVVEDHQGREHVKVCDFGIAKLVEHEGSALTVTGFVCGTPEYMAPEQARGEPLDGRADLYAIGCLLHHLIAGEPPFRGPSALGTITQHLTEEVVPPSRRRPDLHVPHALDAVCLRALEKDRDDRYPDAAAMRAALEEAVDALGELADDPLGTHTDDPTAPPPPTPPAAPSRWGLPLLIGLGVALLVGVAIRASRSEEPAPPPLEPLASAPEDAAATEAPADAADPPSGGATRAAAAEAESTEAATAAAGADVAGADVAGADVAGADVAGADVAGADVAGADVATGADDSASTMDAELVTARLGAARSGTGGQAMEVAPRAPVPMAPVAASTPTEPRSPAASMTPSAPSAPAAPSAFERGRRRFLTNDLPGAIAAFEEAARTQPRNAQVHKQLGRAYMRSGDVQRAHRAYRRYLELAPSAPDRALVESMLER